MCVLKRAAVCSDSKCTADPAQVTGVCGVYARGAHTRQCESESEWDVRHVPGLSEGEPLRLYILCFSHAASARLRRALSRLSSRIRSRSRASAASRAASARRRSCRSLRSTFEAPTLVPAPAPAPPRVALPDACDGTAPVTREPSSSTSMPPLPAAPPLVARGVRAFSWHTRGE